MNPEAANCVQSSSNVKNTESDSVVKTITVIIPALNEEANIRSTYNEVMNALQGCFEDYEIIVFNDSSVDKTGSIIDELADENPHVKAIHNKVNMGLGYCYLTGVSMAQMNYVILVPGDNEYLGFSIRKMFKFVGYADMVTSYSINMENRPYIRRMLSRLYTLLVNALFNMELNYYNGIVIHRRDILQKMNISTSGFAYQSLILTQFLCSGHTFLEVGTYLRPRKSGRSTALKLRNVISVLSDVGKHWVKICLLKRQQYNPPGKRIILDDDFSIKQIDHYSHYGHK